eukprot:gene10131-biopygen1034
MCCETQASRLWLADDGARATICAAARSAAALGRSYFLQSM